MGEVTVDWMAAELQLQQHWREQHTLQQKLAQQQLKAQQEANAQQQANTASFDQCLFNYLNALGIWLANQSNDDQTNAGELLAAEQALVPQFLDKLPPRIPTASDMVNYCVDAGLTDEQQLNTKANRAWRLAIGVVAQNNISAAAFKQAFEFELQQYKKDIIRHFTPKFVALEALKKQEQRENLYLKLAVVSLSLTCLALFATVGGFFPAVPLIVIFGLLTLLFIRDRTKYSFSSKSLAIHMEAAKHPHPQPHRGQFLQHYLDKINKASKPADEPSNSIEPMAVDISSYAFYARKGIARHFKL